MIEESSSDLGTNGGSSISSTKVFATTYTTVMYFFFHPKADVIEFNMEKTFSGIVKGFSAVDPTIFFKSWNCNNEHQIGSEATISKSENEMREFVEDHVFMVESIWVSTVAFSFFRKDETFTAFIRNTGLFIERMETYNAHGLVNLNFSTKKFLMIPASHFL